MTLPEFQALRASMGYPDVPVPEPREWGNEDYSPQFYTASSVQKRVPNWQNPNPREVWKRATALTPEVPMAEDETTGLLRNPAGPTGVTGLGRLHNYGPNLTSDSIIKWGRSLLFIIRGDTGQLAFPGGFRDLDANNTNDEYPYESAEDAARREAEEETGLILPRIIQPTEVYSGPSAWSLRNTDVAWIHNWAGLFDITEYFDFPPNIDGQDDAVDAKWIEMDEVDPSLMSDTHAANVMRVRNMQNHQG